MVTRHTITVNRAPVLTLWAAVVAQRLGFKRDEALTLGRAVAGLNAYSKGKSLGLFKPSRQTTAEQRKRLPAGRTAKVDLLGRAVPVKRTADGLRALSRGKPISPDSVQRYLDTKFAGGLADTRRAMMALAKSYPPAELADQAYGLYEKFRPAVPAGRKGWGAAGRLSLDKIRRLAEESA